MRKTNSKKKVVKDTQKISTFFKKLDVTTKTQKPVGFESDDDIVPGTPIAKKQESKKVLSPITSNLVRKRKLSPCDSSINQNTKKSTKTENIPPAKFEDIPSTSRAIINITASDKLFNGNSNFHVDGTLLQNVGDESTPEKKKFSPVIGDKSSEKRKKSVLRTNSPKKKLFENLPDVNEFRVDVIKNFITVTPSKSNKKAVDNTPAKSSEKKQKSILNYISPSLSSCKSQKAQSENESTPVKTPSKTEFLPTSSKVKMKLTFGALGTNKSRTAEIENEEKCQKAVEEIVADPMNLFNDSWDNLNLSQETDTLDLSKPKRCTIIRIENLGRFQIEVRLQCTETEEKANCILEGFWAMTKFEVGSKVYIDAVKHGETWKLTNDDGLLVFEPDLLISSTSVVSALFCKRRSVLKERFVGFEPENKAMIVGTLVHSLLQNALKSRVDNSKKMDEILKNLLDSKNMVRMLYNSSLALEEITNELSSFLPRILEFIQDYVKNNKSYNLKPDNWKGHIDSILDIEENIWCPELGIKGKVDVSVSVSDEIMPLELKTGKASFSLEHRGQVMIYIMMMLKFGYKVSSGLLLYLRDGTLRAIPYNESEKRDIIMLRNELAYYLTRKTQISDHKIEENVIENGEKLMAKDIGSLESMELPDPIKHHSACAYCPYNIVCCSYLRYQNYNLSSFKALKEVNDKVLEHLSDKHIEYFVHWSNLLDLEGTSKTGKAVSTIYTKSPEEREKMGRCIINLRLSDCVIEGDMFSHTFQKPISEHCRTFLTSGLGENSYVVVSTERRPAVSSGLVTIVNHDSIIISLDRNLRDKYPDSKFHIDSYDSNSVNFIDFTNLSLLLEPNERANKLRSLIIDKLPPVFVNKLPKIVAQKAPIVLKSLNKVQQRAALRSLTANDYVLIQGMPGTGKTATIVALVQLLTEIGQTVLITSHTHSAVDNVCLRLKKNGIKVLRLGTQGRIHPDLLDMSEGFLTKDCSTPAQLDQVYKDAKILAVTCFGSRHTVLTKRTLDVCIVDESTQVLQCSAIRALMVCKKFILIGDPQQLPPVVKNRDAIARGMSVSLFERLQSEATTVTLNLNYRMNKTITKLANDFMYNGKLQTANDTVSNACLKLSTKEHLQGSDKKWVSETLDSRLESAVKVIDTGATFKIKLRPKWLGTLCVDFVDGEEQKICTNASETALVVTITEALLKGGVSKEDIGVIAPYRAQVAQLSTVLQTTGVDVSTVDQFQGKDKSVIIYSCTKSRDPNKISHISKFDILEDRRRLNVAITRAKHKFILIGDLATIKKYSPFAKLLECIENCHFIQLQNEIYGFEWKHIID